MTDISARSVPDSQQLEVSLFGSGVGECVVVHLGFGEWMIVDSCRHPETQQPVALQYLKSINVDPACAVKLVVISHWHDDHVAGMTEVVDTCKNARVAFSGALANDEFLRLVATYAQPNLILDRGKSGVHEMSRVLSILKDRKKKPLQGQNSPPHRLCAPDQLLYKSKTATCEVISLSPSDEAVTRALTEFGNLQPKVNTDRVRITSPERNHSAVVLWVKFNSIRALLGADLQETADTYTGWSAVLKSVVLPDGKATVFKIPHHGSANAHSDDVWSQLIDKEEPIAIMTTYNRGKTPLPRDTDIERILQKTDRTYSTTVPKAAAPRRLNVVDKMLNEVVKNRRTINRATGHIRVRMSPPCAPSVDLYGYATQLSLPANLIC